MQTLNAFQLKWIAIIGMVFNHISLAFDAVIPLWLDIPIYAVGGLTFPIMAYFAVEGYRHTRSLDSYTGRLALFGAIAIPFHALVFGGWGLNIMFTIIVGLFCLWLHDSMIKRRMQVQFWVIFAGICGLMAWQPVHFDWSVIGVIMIVLTHVIKHEPARRVVPPLLAASWWTLPALLTFDLSSVSIFTLVFALGSVLAALLLFNYNGQRGRPMKWTFYIAYPAHLAVIGLAAFALDLTRLPPLPGFLSFLPWP
ncbi:MAG: conjugal transfer protein TraX [Oscillospiraceae bacterium]|nr:conjugal transfer protein TraX [Oscillospiraceae bacterium]